MPQSQSDGILASVGMIFLILGVSTLVPGVIVNLESPQKTTFTQAVDERTVITGDLSSQVTVISNQQEVNASLVDRKTGEFNSTGQLTPGDTTNVTIDGKNVTVSLIETFGTNEAVLTYEYPLYLGWPDSASLIVSEAPLLILLATVVLLLGLLFTVHGVFY
jgi:hypothetical protein